MLGHLSTCTRRFVQQLINGEPTIIGGKSITALSESQRTLLKVFAINLPTLRERKGNDLTTEVERLLANVPEFIVTGILADSSSPPPPPRKLGRICARSFRGIAPAGSDWEHDFESKSHLLHGPNGCGKSSLFGAISWCLTGQLFRDDGPPSPPESVPYYSRGKKPKVEGTRPDALTLIASDGSLSSPSETYSVKLELVSTTDPTDRVWLQRHSTDGLSSSLDGENWSAINEVSDIRISDLDVELQVLMPARIGHFHFGKDSGVLSLFSQIVGLDDLELISDVASKCHTTFMKEANTIEKKDLKDIHQAIAATLVSIEHSVPQHVKDMPGYAGATGNQRTLDDIKAFRKAVDDRIASLTSQLATDLGIVLPNAQSPEAEAMAKQLDLLPGHIDSATTALALPLAQLFRTSVGLPIRSAEEIRAEQAALRSFVTLVQGRITERLDWAVRERQSKTAGLMLLAAEHFPPGSTHCPVCTQDLKPVPAVVESLTSLQPLIGQPHLKQPIDDFERSLLSELDQVVARQRRDASGDGLGTRIQADWKLLKASRLLGLVTTIAERFDATINTLSVSLGSTVPAVASVVSDLHRNAFPNAFESIQLAIRDANLAIAFDENRATADERMTTTITAALTHGRDSLAGILQRGRETNQQIKELSGLRTQLNSLQQSQIEADKLKARIHQLKELFTASTAIKDLGDHVRQETINVVKDVAPVMTAYYERLYDKEHLPLDLVTPGHAANPNVKDEFNVYLRAGDSRLPAGPFANAGRLRALALCFAFSLHKRAHGTLAFHLLDDPAMSLDDEHKARFVDHVIGPCLDCDQVLLATHYENFYKCAELRFQAGERLQLVPRRSAEDAISFEPADLLQRVKVALDANTTAWREVGINIRRWGERALATLSGYCPRPFVIFNKLPDTVSAYAAISDKRVASDQRDRIVTALRSAQFVSVVNKLAHDETVTKADVSDALTILNGCRKDTEAEIERFRELYKHDLLKRGISPRPSLGILRIDAHSPAKDVVVTGHAAAASNGVGVTWIEPRTLKLPKSPIVVIRADVLAPIAAVGHFAILDDSETLPSDGDLVAVGTRDDHSYLRRFWSHDGFVNLEATNPTSLFAPVVLPADHCKVRRVVGVLFDGVNPRPAGPGQEWGVPGNLSATRLDGLLGIRVDGTSLEPVARDGQVVLVRSPDNLRDISNGELACIDAQDLGAVLKRCYAIGNQLILCPVNPVDVEEPIIVEISAVLHAYKIVGVLFEPVEATDDAVGE